MLGFILSLLIKYYIHGYYYQQSASRTVQPSSQVQGGMVEGRQLAVGSRYGNTEEIKKYVKEVWKEDTLLAYALIQCESGFNVSAVSPSGKYKGLFQFDSNTFNGNCVGSIDNWRDQAKCAKKLIDRGEIYRWPTCRWRI